MEISNLVDDLRSGKSVAYLKENYGQEFLEEHGLGNLKRNHAWTNRVENINNVANYLKGNEEVESLEYIVDTVRNVSWDQVRRIKNRDKVVNGIEKINQTYTRYIDRVYSQRNVEEIVDEGLEEYRTEREKFERDHVVYEIESLKELTEKEESEGDYVEYEIERLEELTEEEYFDLGVSRTEREVNDWYNGMISVRNPSLFLREKLDELEERGVRTRVGKDYARTYLNEVSLRVQDKFPEKDLIRLGNVLDSFSRKWGVGYDQIILPKKNRSLMKVGVVGALALIGAGVAFGQGSDVEFKMNVSDSSNVQERLYYGGTSLSSSETSSYVAPQNIDSVYFDWEDKNVEKKDIFSLDAEKMEFANLENIRGDFVDFDFYVINEDGRKVGNLPSGLKIDIIGAKGNPLATDYEVCNEKWMFLVNGVYRCDVNPEDYFEGV